MGIANISSQPAAGSCPPQISIQDHAVWIFHATWQNGKTLGGTISFIFFRVVSFFTPMVGLQLEVVWVRIANIWEKVKGQWREHCLHGTVDHLSNENYTLRGRLQQSEEEKSQLSKEKQTLTLALAQAASDLQREKQDKNFWSQKCQLLTQEIDALRQHRDFLLKQQPPPVLYQTHLNTTAIQKNLELLPTRFLDAQQKMIQRVCTILEAHS